MWSFATTSSRRRVVAKGWVLKLEKPSVLHAQSLTASTVISTWERMEATKTTTEARESFMMIATDKRWMSKPQNYELCFASFAGVGWRYVDSQQYTPYLFCWAICLRINTIRDSRTSYEKVFDLCLLFCWANLLANNTIRDSQYTWYLYLNKTTKCYR